MVVSTPPLKLKLNFYVPQSFTQPLQNPVHATGQKHRHMDWGGCSPLQGLYFHTFTYKNFSEGGRNFNFTPFPRTNVFKEWV